MAKTRKQLFNENYGDRTGDELLLEILYESKKQTEKQERTRRNTSVLVWVFVGIPLIIFIVWLVGAIGLFTAVL